MDKGQLKLAQDWVNLSKNAWMEPGGIIPFPPVGSNVDGVLSRLKRAWSEGKKDSARKQIDRIKEMSLSPLEIGVAYLYCGHILVEMGEIGEAEEFFYNAVINIPRSYSSYLAVLNWILGILYWLEAEKRFRATELWDDSIQYFTDLSLKASTDMKKKLWYQKQITFMSNALELAINEDQLPELDLIEGVPSIPKNTARRTYGAGRRRTTGQARRTKRS